MGDLGDEERAGAVGDVGAKAHDEAAGEVQGVSSGVRLFRETLHQRPGDDEDASDGSALLPAKAVGDIWCE